MGLEFQEKMIMVGGLICVLEGGLSVSSTLKKKWEIEGTPVYGRIASQKGAEKFRRIKVGW